MLPLLVARPRRSARARARHDRGSLRRGVGVLQARRRAARGPPRAPQARDGRRLHRHRRRDPGDRPRDGLVAGARPCAPRAGAAAASATRCGTRCSSRSVRAAARGRAFGVERAMDQCGAVLAPLVVILLLQNRTRASIASFSGPSSLACSPPLAMMVLVRERPRLRARRRRAGPGRIPALASLPPQFRRFLLALFVFGSGDFAKTLLVLWALGAGVESIADAGYTTPHPALRRLQRRDGRRRARRRPPLRRARPRRVLVVGYAVGVLGALVPVVAPASVAAAAVALGSLRHPRRASKSRSSAHGPPISRVRRQARPRLRMGARDQRHRRPHRLRPRRRAVVGRRARPSRSAWPRS